MALALSAAAVNIGLITPLSCTIVWYERYGSDLRRSLINKLVASICWNIIFQNLVIQPLEIFLTLYGPFGLWFCSFNMVLKYSSFFHLVAIIFFMTLVKYLSIFKLQNPMSIKSEFWYLMINLVTGFLGILSQTVYFALPGRKPTNYYICKGEDPGHLEHEQVIRNIPFALIVVVSFLFQSFALIRIKLYERQAEPQTGNQGTDANPRTFHQASLVSLGSIIVLFGSFVLVSAAYATINNLSTKQLESKPSLVLLHFFHHGIELVWNSAIIALFCLKSNSMRTAIKQIIVKDIPDMVLCKV